MASFQVSHLSLASTHRPSIATTFLIVVSVSLVPFFAFSWCELIPSTFPDFAYTLWDSLWGVASSSPFYFFLLNFLIVALVCLSGVLDPSSKRQDSAELQDGDPHQRDSYSAAHILHDRLAALDEIYGSHTPSPSYLRLFERSNVYVANEEHYEDGRTKPATSKLRQNFAFTEMDACIASSSNAHLSSADVKLDTLAASPGANLLIENGCIVDNQDDTISHVNRNMDAKDMHVSEDTDVREEAGNGVHSGKSYDDGAGQNRAVGSDVQSGVDGADNIDVKGMHDDHDHDDDDHHHHGDAFHEQPSQAPILQMAETHPGTDGQGNVGEDEDQSEDEIIADAREPSDQGKAGEGQGQEMVMAQDEREEEQMMMSREELNERASAFISAFRRKLTAAIVDDD